MGFTCILKTNIVLDGRYWDCNTFHKQRILGTSNLKEFAEDNFEFGENGRNFSESVEKNEGKGEIAHVFKRLKLQTRKIQGLFGKGLICS